MKDTAGIITMACDGDQGSSLIRMSLTVEEAVLAHIAFERSRLHANSGYAILASGQTE